MKNNLKQDKRRLSSICRMCRYGIGIHKKGLTECDIKHPGCPESLMEHIVELVKKDV